MYPDDVRILRHRITEMHDYAVIAERDYPSDPYGTTNDAYLAGKRIRALEIAHNLQYLVPGVEFKQVCPLCPSDSDSDSVQRAERTTP